ncbi:MAG: hypothetical protein AB7R40_23780 [Nitrospiraceae bacterium]
MTDGIIEARERRRGEPYAWVEWPNGLNGQMMFSKKDWHETAEAALAQADAMRLKKIASLKKQIAKLEAMRFR